MNKKVLAAIIAGGSVVLAMVALVIIIKFNNRLFSSYNVIHEWRRKDSNTMQYLTYNGNYLKYSKEGASAFDNEGKVIWNGGYEMETPCVDICGEYVVIYDVGGKELFVYNGEDSGTRLEMALPIVKARVAKQGVVAVLLEDADSNTIRIYNPYSSTASLLVEIPTNIAGNGYPMDFDISDDGNSLVASYLVIESGAVSNKANFYNFTEVGQDKNRLVKGKSFENSIITRIEFSGSDQVVIFHQKGFSIFEEMKQPKEVVTKTFEEKIRSVAFGERHIGIITESAKEGGNTLQLFSHTGRKELEYPIVYDYDEVVLHEDELIFTTKKKCNILRGNGKEKFKFVFERNVMCFLPGENSGEYLLVDENMIQKIKLKGG